MAFTKKEPTPDAERPKFDYRGAAQYNLGREMLRTANALHILAAEARDPKFALDCLQEARQIIRLGVEAEKVRLQTQKQVMKDIPQLPNQSALQEAVARRKVSALRRPITIVVDEPEKPKDVDDAATS